ncbi:MAG: sirohydrochlorin chelatase [Pirellulales bacterium]
MKSEPSSSPSIGVLVVGHGTRDPRGQAEFLAAVQQIAAQASDQMVRPCYLELVEPGIDEGIDRLAAEGATTIVVAPLLLFAAGHAKRDVPRAVDAARLRHPQIHFVQAAHLGCHPRILELSDRRYRAASQVGSARGGRSTLWIVVGRGSLDREALAEMEHFAQLRMATTGADDYVVCYLAMAQPSLAETLAKNAEWRYDRVILQPHLLFHGELLETIRMQVDACSRQHDSIEWLLCGHLGPDVAVAEALAGRVREALILP